jgi:hypothetical protein
MTRRSKLIVAIAIGILGASATSAFAETAWERSHPRRDQVNDRLENLNARINHEYREGELTPWQARRLHAEDRMIRGEERTMAGFDHGHITRGEERLLNSQENELSRTIGR